MPRLSNALYLERHRFLRTAWLEFDHLFSALPEAQQWDLHAYYLPAKDVSDEQLLEHRQTIGKRRPSLGAKSGRSFEFIYSTFCQAFEQAQGDDMRFRQIIGDLGRQAQTTIHGKRQIRVRALARPEIDVEKLARALLEVAASSNKEGAL